MLQSRRTALALAVLFAAGCRSATDIHEVPPELTSLPRELTAAEQQVKTSANDFSFALFRTVSAAQPQENVFISPLSASFALGMTLNGASGTTFDAMRTTLQAQGVEQQAINAGYKGLTGLLTGLDPSTTFDIANSIWYRNSFPFHQAFLDDGRTWFDAEIQALDFGSAQALPTINGWVNEQTNGKIPSILDDISPDDVMFLINAIYFKGSWRERFDPAKTRTAPFHAIDGTTQDMRLMYRELGDSSALRFYWGQDFAAADLPYGNGAWAMTVLLPHPGKDVNAIASSLTETTWATAVAGLRRSDVAAIGLPKLKLSYERTLNDDLTALGMGVAFDPVTASFARMSPAGDDLFISMVKQKAYVDIHEEGTEAAAVTVVGIRVVSAPPSFVVDRPYLFVIRERLSGTILFMGKIVKMPN